MSEDGYSSSSSDEARGAGASACLTVGWDSLSQEPRPFGTGLVFGNVDNKLRLVKSEGRYIEEVRLCTGV